LLLLSAEM